jgi:hypothetical protein
MALVSRLAENPNSIFCDRPKSPRQQMDGWFCVSRKSPAERQNCATDENLSEVTKLRALQARIGISCFLLTETYHGWPVSLNVKSARSTWCCVG